MSKQDVNIREPYYIYLIKITLLYTQTIGNNNNKCI